MEIDHKLFNESHIVLESKAKSQQEAFQELAELAFKLGYVTSVEALVAGFTKRESESSTGFEDGFAISHALIPEVTKPAILFLRMANGVDWKSMDGKPTKIAIAIIIPGDKATELHLDVLSSISVKLVDKGFRDNLKHAKTPQEVLTLMGSDVKQSKKVVPTGKTIVGVSACTTGVVHTYMCKELLEQAGAKMGYNIHIECQGQKGLEYEIPKKMLDEAEVVILANDVGIDMDRFIGKKVYPCGTAPVVKDAEKVIKDALAKGYIYGESNDNSDFIANSGRGKPAILKHLLSVVSYMILFVVFVGLCFAIMSGIAKGTYGDGFGFGSSWNIGQTAADGHVITLADWGATKNFNLLQMAHVLMIINNIANIGFGLMIPIMGGYIAFSIAGRPGIAPAMIVTYMLVNPGSGLWWDFNGALNLNGGVIDAHQPFQGNANNSWTLFGAIYAGLICGYLVKYVNSWKVPKWLAPIMPIIIIPLFCTAIVAIPTAFLLAATFGYVMGGLDYGLSWMGIRPNIGFLVGLILGAMVGFDMGGPINKIAVLVPTSMMVQDHGRLMRPVAAAIPIAPLGCALTSTVLGRKLFTAQEKSLGWNAWLLGFMGISESAIPFAARDTWRTIVANVVGSAVAGALAFAFNVAGHVGAWGSFIIALFGGVTDTAGNYIGILWYIIAMLIGTVVNH